MLAVGTTSKPSPANRNTAPWAIFSETLFNYAIQTSFHRDGLIDKEEECHHLYGMYHQTPEDYKRLFQEQIDALRISSLAYDNGSHGEAKRLATVVRVLVHDTGRSKSLLKQLGKKDLKYYASPAPTIPSYEGFGCPLIYLRIAPTRSCSSLLYHPKLDDFSPEEEWRRLEFDEWWKEVVLVDRDGNEFSREALILPMANKDGGGHVDFKLGEPYARLSRKGSAGLLVLDLKNFPARGTRIPSYGPEYACVRQVTHEILKTIEEQLPGLFC